MTTRADRRTPDAVIIVAIMIVAALVLALIGTGEPVLVPGGLDMGGSSITGAQS